MLNFYMDDSGTRHPDKRFGQPTGRPDFFALGGILISDEDERVARELHAEFCEKWGISDPLHSVEIRHKTDKFDWLYELEPGGYERFMTELEAFLLAVPGYGLACVIDRPGYNKRYRPIYGRDRWSLCKTAFCIAVERAVKYALDKDDRLRILPERSCKKDEGKLKEYYNLLRETGSPFDAGRSAAYRPLLSGDFKKVLYDLKVKFKSSPMVQIADMYLWPLCQGRYNPGYRPLQRLIEAGKLLECLYPPEQAAERGTKYSCFD